MILSVVFIAPSQIVSQELQIEAMPLSAQIDHFAKLYGTDGSVVKKVIECESNGKQTAVGDGGRSIGIAQFQKPTWINLESLYFKEYNEHLNYESQIDQVKLLTYSIANGHGSNWTAYRAIMNGGKYSFYSNQMKRHYVVYCKV